MARLHRPRRRTVGIVLLAVVAILAWICLEHLPIGRRLYAIGSNRRAAELIGVPARRLVMGAFDSSGLIVGLAGVILAVAGIAMLVGMVSAVGVAWRTMAVVRPTAGLSPAAMAKASANGRATTPGASGSRTSPGWTT